MATKREPNMKIHISSSQMRRGTGKGRERSRLRNGRREAKRKETFFMHGKHSGDQGGERDGKILRTTEEECC